MILNNYLREKKTLVEKNLSQYFQQEYDIPVIYEAMKYSLLAGGKRIRPILAVMACELFDGDIKKVMPFACSIEMIHTYSLIHDDLPAMDNDDFRRGKLTNHKVYGEAFAILAGDALLNLAFEIMLDEIYTDMTYENVRAARLIGKACGVKGMIGGQCIDISNEGNKINADILNDMHKKKTGAMLAVPMTVGAIIAGAKDDDIEVISEYGKLIGLAFQIVDDILDVEGKIEKLGKPIGSDGNNNKATYVSIYGIDKSKTIAHDLINKAKQLLGKYGEKSSLLVQLADYIVDRDV